MKNLKERKSLLIKLLAVILLVLLCYILPGQLLFWKLCSEQDRNIPPNTEILVSACKEPSAIGVPGGEVLFVREDRTNKVYLLDLRSGEKKDVPNDPLLWGERVVFLSPELIWLEGRLVGPNHPSYSPDYILDLTNGQRYELLDLKLLTRLKDGKFNPDNYVYIKSAEHVFIHPSDFILIALSSNFRANQNERVVLFGDGDFLEQLIRSLGMDYKVVDLSLRDTDVLSPTGKYIVRKGGIYLSKTNKRLETPIMEYYFKGWYFDESGVVVQKSPTHWIRSPFIGFHYKLYNPILKLHLPAQ